VERKHRSIDLFAAAAVAVGVLFLCFSSLAYGLMISGTEEQYYLELLACKIWSSVDPEPATSEGA
jgi:hypothetical protein